MVQIQASARALKRGELAQRTGCNLETIRYYEKVGLLPAPPRAANGHRIYDAAHQQRLRFILRGRALGFDIVEIRGLLALMDGGHQTCAEVKARTDRHLADIRAKIADLQRMARVLTRTSAQCSGDMVPECPIIEALAS
ncbi:MAG: helix-turn-helix domain-containing protein [Alphaproteobacteria bacterium]|nr:helix-turn-helix domain-containing protein [Alphaproteobacteria bacterium]